MTTDPIAAWYNQNADLEDKRLDLGLVERAVTMDKIKKLIGKMNKPSCRIADIGCGTGAYALELASLGHSLYISDISSTEVEAAVKKAQDAGVKFEHASACDARLTAENAGIYRREHYDLVLLLGPLYHILDEGDRIRLVKTSLEMVKPNGYVLGAFVTQNAHLRDIATRDAGRLLKEWNFYQEYLASGLYTREKSVSMHHTSPAGIRELISKVSAVADLQLEGLVACEGFLGFQHGSSLARLDKSSREAWFKVLLQTTEEEANLGASDHILAVIKRV